MTKHETVKRAVFLASFPLTASAFKAHGDGGYRITLDLPESEARAAALLMGMRRRLLRVTVEDIGDAESTSE